MGKEKGASVTPRDHQGLMHSCPSWKSSKCGLRRFVPERSGNDLFAHAYPAHAYPAHAEHPLYKKPGVPREAAMCCFAGVKARTDWRLVTEMVEDGIFHYWTGKGGVEGSRGRTEKWPLLCQVRLDHTYRDLTLFSAIWRRGLPNI